MKKANYVVWLTGISNSGKTTVSRELMKYLDTNKIDYVFLDGDLVRDFFENDLGYSRQDRLHNIRRIAFAAKLLADNGHLVLVANIAPYFEARDFIRRKIKNYIQVYMKVSLKECAARDTKDIYEKALKGLKKNVIGVDDKYDEPRNPDLIIDTDVTDVETCASKILNLLKQKNIL
ncbi:MAG TPA: adenylyl-sulfate kinase [bacterium]|nr:adenylyl-sulfate kinase [bacterium]HPN30089.1 adenylyl-sulfate kinase [bacterium]